MYHSTWRYGGKISLRKAPRAIASSWPSSLSPLSVASNATLRFNASSRRDASSALPGRFGLYPMKWNVIEPSSSWLIRRNTELSGTIQRRSMAKDVVGMGITVTRKKGKESGYCYGCGADLVKEGVAGTTTTAPKKKGFWADQKDTLKKAQIKNWALCPRCRKLRDLEVDEGSLDEDTSRSLGPDGKMTEVFRAEVATIRTKEKCVVVMCVDAINISGTLIRTIRNYVGGNPILLAVTRCDLLPDYVLEDKSIDELKEYFRQRCQEIYPAAVYLCSEDKQTMQQLGGIKELAADLWEHLNGRDPFVIGAANIGKSTLTDILIAGFINRGERLGHFRDRLAIKRVEKLREARITKSALPGTTLQNIRVPCFVDHQQALWDTPGLLLDESTAHFPIRNFRAIRAQRPQQIQPHIMEVTKKSFCLLISERDDEFPLIRVEVRLKKDDQEQDGPVHIIWNSTLDLDTKIVEIKEAHEAEHDRFKKYILDAPTPTPEPPPLVEQPERPANAPPLTKAEKERIKEEKRKAYLARIAQEKKEIGIEEWLRREEERKRKFFDEHRHRALGKLVEVNQVVVDAEVGMDVSIFNFGWIGFVSSRTAMIKTYAPSTGVRVLCTPTMALPQSVGSYRLPKVEKEKSPKRKGYPPSIDEDGDDDDEEFDPDEDYLLDDGDMNFGDFTDGDLEFGGGNEYDGYSGYDEFGFEGTAEFEDERGGRGKRRWYFPEQHQMDKEDKDDPWARFSGQNIGWQFDADMRFSKNKSLVEGWVRCGGILCLRPSYDHFLTEVSLSAILQNPMPENGPNKKKEDIDDIF
jgi:ribosome biogenesis GTPase A